LIAACLAFSAFSRDRRVASAFSAALASFFISFLDFFGLSVGVATATAAGIGGTGIELGGGERVSTTDRLRGLGLIGKVEGGCREGTSASVRACGTTLGEAIGDADGDAAGEAPAGRGAMWISSAGGDGSGELYWPERLDVTDGEELPYPRGWKFYTVSNVLGIVDCEMAHLSPVETPSAHARALGHWRTAQRTMSTVVH
jgi:hypothetical protein